MKKNEKKVEEIEKLAPKEQVLQKPVEEVRVEVKKGDQMLVNEEKKSEVKI